MIESKGEHNEGFDPSPEKPPPDEEKQSEAEPDDRQTWDKPLQFLMSCIATSVGLGNVWRFPFVAYQNGGGAFLIPYIIVLLLIGKPMYYLETFIGQFSSSNCVRVWAVVPAMKGTGYVQASSAFFVLSYYMSIIALCLYYLAMSFQSQLPWTVCQPDWDNCIASGDQGVNGTSSAEYYFKNTVLRQLDGIEDGLGLPLWDLTLCLFVSWFLVFIIVYRGVKTSGKASYFLAIFPYIILIILLIRAVSLPGAGKGILFFITPEWNKILELSVWYAAVTQVFFSLSVCSGALIMFSSYNTFRLNVYRDSMIVTTLDTLTSLISGITIFGVLGNLAYELGYDDVGAVIGSGGTGLAFITYPEAIAKSPVPQLFAVLFFLMLAVLGIGSGVALFSTINTIVIDAFPRVKLYYLSGIGCSIGFLVGLVYVTPGGQYVLELVDHYGGTFTRLFAGICECIGIFWIYGLDNLTLDIEFTLNIKTSIYWRLCWGVITPAIMIVVCIYALVSTNTLEFGDGYIYPKAAYICGDLMMYFCIALVPIFICATLYKRRTGNCKETIKTSFKPKSTWGPRSPALRREWQRFRQEAEAERVKRSSNILMHVWYSLTGCHRRKK